MLDTRLVPMAAVMALISGLSGGSDVEKRIVRSPKPVATKAA